MNVSSLILDFKNKMASTSALKSKRETIEELVEKQEIWAFTDTECRVDNKISFKWSTMFEAFHTKEFEVFV